MNTSIRCRFVVVPLAILVSVVTFGCSQGSGDEFSSPTSPTVNVDKVQPKPAPGTVDHPVSISGEEFPLHVWVTEMSPVRGSTLQLGQTVSVSYTCGGPAGYSAFISAELMSGVYTAGSVQYGVPKELGDSFRGAGAVYRVGDKCDATGTDYQQVTVTTPDITHVVFHVWVVKGVGLMPDRSLTPTIFEERLDLNKPMTQ